MFYICSPNLGALYPDMKLSQFKFELPEKLIAQEPLKTRHESRLMVVDRKPARLSIKSSMMYWIFSMKTMFLL